MLQPSSLPLGVRSVEWLRNNHGNWLVDNVEHIYYSWKAPKKGGPQLKTLPAVGLLAKARTHKTAWPPRIKPVFAHPLPGEGVWKRTGLSTEDARPSHNVPHRARLSADRRVRRLVRHKRTALAFYPGRYEPPSAPVRGPMSVPYSQRWRLLATFNGGFTYIDGHNGSAINGRTYEPLKDGLATLIGYRDGHIDIKTWIGGPNAGPGIVFARPEPAADHRERSTQPHAQRQLSMGPHAGQRVRVWRTGVGIDRRRQRDYARPTTRP